MFSIKKIDRLVLTAFLKVFFLVFTLVIFIFLITTFITNFEYLIGKGLSVLIYGELFSYLGAMLSTNVFPIAILISAAIAMSALAETSELTAMRSIGLSFFDVIRNRHFLFY
jgi:lipopolysaccharide export system permease protein